MVKKATSGDWDLDSHERMESEAVQDPIDLVESILTEESLSFERSDDGQIAFVVEGAWKSYDMWFSWHEAGDCLQLCAGLGLPSLAVEKYPGLFELLSLVNQRVWFGHFEIFEHGSEPHSLQLSDKSPEPPRDQPHGTDIALRLGMPISITEPPSMIGLANMINRAAEAVDAFYPAFDLWLKGGLSPAQALDACMFETMGEA